MTVPCCPRCGDQTLWHHYRGLASCQLCGHTWTFDPDVFACDDPEGDWIRDQQQEANRD